MKDQDVIAFFTKLINKYFNTDPTYSLPVKWISTEKLIDNIEKDSNEWKLLTTVPTEIEFTPRAVSKKCSCDTFTLMNTGCSCGGK